MNNKLVACSADVKICAKQIVHEAFRDILCGNFDIPSQSDMEHVLKDYIDYDFDEYEGKKKVLSKHPNWDEEQISNEVYKIKRRYDKDYRDNLNQATLESIAEIENLIASLDDTIKAWKIKNLG